MTLVADGYEQLHSRLADEGYADQNRHVLEDFDRVTAAYRSVEAGMSRRSVSARARALLAAEFVLSSALPFVGGGIRPGGLAHREAPGAVARESRRLWGACLASGFAMEAGRQNVPLGEAMILTGHQHTHGEAVLSDRRGSAD